MNSLSKQTVTRLKASFTAGTVVRLLYMDDPQAPPIGTIGVVQGVDDLGNILVHWSNGCGLSLIPYMDEFEIIL